MKLADCFLLLGAGAFIGTQPAWSQVPSRDEGVRDALSEELSVYTAEDAAALATRFTEEESRPSATPITFQREQMLALNARTVFDVLDTVPGITVSKGVDGFYRAGVRGVRNEAEVLFILNDQPLNNLYQGRALAELPIENIERIEIWVGPGSAFSNLGGFLATVKVFTHPPDALRLGLGLTTAVSADAHASTRLMADRWLFQLEGDAVRQNVPNPDEGQFADIGARVGYALEGRGQLGLTLRYMDDGRRPQVQPPAPIGGKSHWQVLMGQLQWQQPLAGKSSLSLRAYADSQSLSESAQHNSQRLGGEFESLLVSNSHHFLLGLLAESQSFTPSGSSYSHLVLKLNAQDEWWISRLVALSFGFNLEGAQLQAASYQPYLNPRLGLSVSPTGAVSLKLLFARAVRYPTFAEQADPSNGRSGFLPPLVDSIELKGEGRFSVGDAVGTVHLAIFYQQFDRGTDAANIHRTLHSVGTEVSAQLAWKDVRIWINGSWVQLTDDSVQGASVLNNDLPRLRLNAGTSIPFLEWLACDLLLKMGSPRTHLPSYYLLTVQLRTREFLKPFEIYAGIQNLFSSGYADDAPSNFIPPVVPRDGVQGFARVRVSL